MLSYICPELGVTPLLDSGTDLEDELPSPDASSMVMALLPAQVEEDVDLAHVLAEFSTLPAIVTPMHDPAEERVVPPAEYRPPEAPVVLLVTPAGSCLTTMCGHGGLFADYSDDSGGANAGEELALPRTDVG